jgi:serine/threonine protein phosphatase 1
MELLKKIDFNKSDNLYVLGDIVDRGNASLECIEYVCSNPNIICLMGNHELMKLKYIENASVLTHDKYNDWLKYGGAYMLQQLQQSPALPDGWRINATERMGKLLDWFRELPLYLEIDVGGKTYFLSHAGLNAKAFHNNADKNLILQTVEDFVWSRKNFYDYPGLEGKYHIFGHTPTSVIRNSEDSSIWIDPVHNDKTCIDCGCVLGGALAALRLDDGEVFYVNRK